ncbi:carboxypeptidase-like regulatory domain-containing protein [Mesonia aestuariivivens]|uniref:Carboxypeptidase-like regulatory domain-containing protein n=1 Tax=Mesonia aestuariivivens TaxID=2796128 RepID=A0ABS6W5W9_9FLAO|nr:carboxypeptidase-like regulatory domain-containing protein [Mesonia aestuariivivens]MBW2962518.1 carboxypeptidase-like regulatory domain-containing protein [Mesonia aestuariivivens]
MQKFFFLFLFTLFSFVTVAQETDSTLYVKGRVLNAADDTSIEDVNIVNLNEVIGTSTNEKGEFKIKASINDTLFFSYLGYKSIEVRVTNDWKKFGEVKIKMTEIGIALEEVTLKPLKLTGYLEIDAKNIPIYENHRYSISGLNYGYEAGDSQPGAFTRAMESIFNPVDFLYNIFGKKPRQMKKLRKMKEDDEIRNLLAKKFNRETLSALLQVTRVDIDEILRNCNYSDSFIKSANDLQILDAISNCYEEYKVLKRK